jgi:hypothetical protein
LQVAVVVLVRQQAELAQAVAVTELTMQTELLVLPTQAAAVVAVIHLGALLTALLVVQAWLL